ncbi:MULTISPECIES: hypothetical protein [Arthrobacter]|jgi:hypothetical protein|uniref:Uncharacterized protein n=1 Tax=Crystallibacter crystallopoietes TaxID=37928 RepID=A0A1H1CNF6_9MICC|nr:MULTISPECIES: hypothetical protein [Arthrobacter]MCW2131145.1 hypothetical protein [Arthrobacter sp. VKM Ac-2550]NMR28848.1 hypothetical protein [Arthrobacter sp. SF27]SDQ65126.1 hypothetical protein SAMN04489742_1986 [Arthrobacter crystallopoietes]
MYGWIFRHLPGPLWVRIIVSILLIAGAVLLLLQFVFPWLSQFNPLTDSTIGTIE